MRTFTEFWVKFSMPDAVKLLRVPFSVPGALGDGMRSGWRAPAVTVGRLGMSRVRELACPVCRIEDWTP